MFKGALRRERKKQSGHAYVELTGLTLFGCETALRRKLVRPLRNWSKNWLPRRRNSCETGTTK